MEDFCRLSSGLALAEAAVLLVAGELDEGLPLATLRRLFSSDRFLASSVETLVSYGDVVSVRPQTDRRRRAVCVTDHGRHKAARICESMAFRMEAARHGVEASSRLVVAANHLVEKGMSLELAPNCRLWDIPCLAASLFCLQSICGAVLQKTDLTVIECFVLLCLEEDCLEPSLLRPILGQSFGIYPAETDLVLDGLFARDLVSFDRTGGEPTLHLTSDGQNLIETEIPSSYGETQGALIDLCSSIIEEAVLAAGLANSGAGKLGG